MAGKLSIAERYIRDVLAGKIVVSNFVRQAIQRHVDDLEHGAERGLIFDRKAAQNVIDFFPEFLTFDVGRRAGQPFVLEPFQQARLWILYGWKWKATGFRRFKFAYAEMGRGNGKSYEASGLGCYELLASGTPGAEVYSVSTDKKTARLIFDTANLMIQRSPELREHVTCVDENIHIPGTASKFEPCASDPKNLMGLRPSLILMDELHVFVGRGLWDVFVSAMGKQDESLLHINTNSGFDRQSICYKQREYSEKVLSGVVRDDAWFAWICCIDPSDNPFDERVWIKANPGLGTMVSLAFLRGIAQKAKDEPTSLNSFLRYHLSVWTSGDVKWMPPELWRKCGMPVDMERLKGRRCVGALDLSSTGDTTSLGLVFPPDDGDRFWSVKCFFFLPKDAIEQRVKRDRVPYDVWSKDGSLILTPGRVVDYDYMRVKVHEVAEEFDLNEIVYDRWNSSDLVKHLEQDGFTMVKWGQGYGDMNAPMKRLMELVLQEELAHGGEEVLTWQIGNVVASMDAAGNVKPDKAKSREKIDGPVSLMMGLGRGMQLGEVQYTKSYGRVC